MAEMKTELLIPIPVVEKEEPRGPPPRSIDYLMFQACLFFVPTIGLLMFETNYAAANGVPASALEKAEFLFPVYTVIVVFSIVTVIFTWIFRVSEMPRSAGCLIGINAFLVCVMGPMLVWQLLVLQAYHFFIMLAAAILLMVVCVVVGELCEKRSKW